jgi:hypothetical protein
MSYLLPRAIIILIAWGLTSVFVEQLMPDADPVIFAVIGALWALGGAAYCGYRHRLRRDIDELERRRFFPGQTAG